MRPTETFPYEIEDLAGQGAMGAVYRAMEPALGRRVAVKIIKPSFLTELDAHEAREIRQRFLQEARAAARLNHPSVATVYRVGTERGWPYIVMEWLDANSLEHVLANRRTLDLKTALRVGIHILGALSAAHDEGIIHRDIKPGNIMLGRGGRAKLVDFGIARMREDGLTRTRPGLVMGTPWYAAPEQLEARGIDRRSDLYAVGAVLYEALCGQPPFPHHGLLELLRAHRDDRPRVLAERVEGVPTTISDVIMRALARRPGDRFPDARAMAQALRSAVSAPHSTPIPSNRGTMPVLPKVPMVRLSSSSPAEMVVEHVLTWEAKPVGLIGRDRLLRDLSERPLHADAFCGAVRAADTWLLLSDGLIHAALESTGSYRGDAAIERLPDDVEATLYRLPEDSAPEVVELLAAILTSEPRDEESTLLDSTVANLVELQDRLQRNDHDGVLHLSCSEGGRGLVFFRHGFRVLDLLGGDWGRADDGDRWERWIHMLQATAWVERRQPRFPAITYRHQLRSVRLDVRRPEHGNGVREDAVAESQAITLEPARSSADALSRGASTMSHLVHSDPAWALARYVISELPVQFRRHGREERWQGLLDALPHVPSVILHHPQRLGGGGEQVVDAITLDADDRPRHLLHEVALGTSRAVEHFVRMALDARSHPEAGAVLDGAVLLAPRFEDDALETWMNLQKEHAGGFLRGMVASWRHREGLFHVSGRAIHILLVERPDPDNYRPMMPA